MSAPLIQTMTPWLALLLLVAVLTASVVALLSRSLFVACLCLAAAGAAGTAVVLLLGQAASATEFALSAAAWAPLLLIGSTVLSKRAAKARARGPWLSLALGSCAAAVLIWAVLIDAPVSEMGPAIDLKSTALWFAPLFLVLGIGAMALAGYGERGVLERPGEGH